MQRLDHRITIQRPTEARDSTTNEVLLTFADYITIWAKRQDASAGESYKAAEVAASISVRFTVRYSPETATITPKDRVMLEDGLTYDITAVRETARNQWLEIDATSRADQ